MLRQLVHAAKMLRVLLGSKTGRDDMPLPIAEPRDYTASELHTFNGDYSTKPILLAVRGVVYDVTRGRAFYGPRGPYAIFAGNDCTRALAKMSLEEADLKADETGLTTEEIDKLNDWIETFEGKYTRLGRLTAG